MRPQSSCCPQGHGSGRLLPGAGEITHLTQERLGSGGDISHGKCYFLENLGYSGQLKAFSTVAPDTLSWLSQRVISNTCKATSEDLSASSPCFPGDGFTCFASKNQPLVYCFSLFPHGKPFIYSPASPFTQVKEVEEEQLFSSRASVPEMVLFFKLFIKIMRDEKVVSGGESSPIGKHKI